MMDMKNKDDFVVVGSYNLSTRRFSSIVIFKDSGFKMNSGEIGVRESQSSSSGVSNGESSTRLVSGLVVEGDLKLPICSC